LPRLLPPSQANSPTAKTALQEQELEPPVDEADIELGVAPAEQRLVDDAELAPVVLPSLD
jgi:hypothetical protein